MNQTLKFLVILVITAAILALGWYWFMMRSMNALPAEEPGSSVEEDQAPVVVTKTNLAVSGSSLPVGFPSDIPVESGNITESYRVAYNERGVTQYTVSYTSLRSKDTLWDEYNSFMKEAGYAVEPTATSKSQGQIQGTKAEDSLSVVVSLRGGASLVQISFLDRQGQ